MHASLSCFLVSLIEICPGYFVALNPLYLKILIILSNWGIVLDLFLTH